MGILRCALTFCLAVARYAGVPLVDELFELPLDALAFEEVLLDELPQPANTKMPMSVAANHAKRLRWALCMAVIPLSSDVRLPGRPETGGLLD